MLSLQRLVACINYPKFHQIIGFCGPFRSPYAATYNGIFIPIPNENSSIKTQHTDIHHRIYNLRSAHHVHQYGVVLLGRKVFFLRVVADSACVCVCERWVYVCDVNCESSLRARPLIAL